MLIQSKKSRASYEIIVLLLLLEKISQNASISSIHIVQASLTSFDFHTVLS